MTRHFRKDNHTGSLVDFHNQNNQQYYMRDLFFVLFKLYISSLYIYYAP